MHKKTKGASPILLTGGTTGNGYEVTLTITDPTADRTITVPNTSGTMALVDNASAMISNTVFN